MNLYKELNRNCTVRVIRAVLNSRYLVETDTGERFLSEYNHLRPIWEVDGIEIYDYFDVEQKEYINLNPLDLTNNNRFIFVKSHNGTIWSHYWLDKKFVKEAEYSEALNYSKKLHQQIQENK